MNSKFKDFLINYFGSGWLFFVPYLMLYLFYWVLELKVSHLCSVFHGLHLINIVGLLLLISKKYRLIKYIDTFFWLSLASLFLCTGTYIEYPSDPWEHLRRIYEWQKLDLISEASTYKFAYFFGYSLLGWADPTFRYTSLNLYSTLCLTLLSYQLYKLAIVLGFKNIWAKVAVLSNVFFLGYDCIGFYSYHGISSSQISLLASLAAIRSTISISTKHLQSDAFVVVIALLLAGFNHIQGVLIWFAAFGGILISKLISHFGLKRIVMILCTTIIATNIIAIPLTTKFIQDTNFVFNNTFLPWGGINPFKFDHIYKTLGIIGIINIITAIYFIKHNKIIGWITFMPVIILIISCGGLFTMYFLYNHNSPIVAHRLLYACLPLLSLIYSFQIMGTKGYITDEVFAPIVGIILILLSLFHSSPIFGKSISRFIRINPNYLINNMDQVIHSLSKDSILKKDDYILSDSATQFAISSLLGIRSNLPKRRIPVSLTSRIEKIGGIQGILDKKDIAGVLSLSSQPDIETVGSLLGKSSGHWDPLLLRKNFRFDDELENRLDELLQLGWKKSSVTPCYNLYLRPQ